MSCEWRETKQGERSIDESFCSGYVKKQSRWPFHDAVSRRGEPLSAGAECYSLSFLLTLTWIEGRRVSSYYS